MSKKKTKNINSFLSLEFHENVKYFWCPGVCTFEDADQNTNTVQKWGVTQMYVMVYEKLCGQTMNPRWKHLQCTYNLV